MYLKVLAAALTVSSVLTGAVQAAEKTRATHVIVDRNSQTLKVYSGTEVIAESRVSTGRRGFETPTGIFSILQKRRKHFSNIYDGAPMPNMQRLTWTGIALHGSNSVPRRPASHGCIRLPRGFDAKLFRMTQYGAHVIVSRGNVAPQPIINANLFQPKRVDTGALAAADIGTTTDYQRPSAAASMLKVMNGKHLEKSDGLSKSPLRIFITRSNADLNPTLQTQQMLNELGWNAGVEDGLYGSSTRAAIERFQSLVGDEVTGKVSAALVEKLRKITGKGDVSNGRLYVRQDFKNVFDAPINIINPNLPLGAHLISATSVDKEKGEANWISISLKNRLTAYEKKRFDISADSSELRQDVQETLSRIEIPTDVRARIEALLTPGSSISISDKGLGRFTSRKGGTDFIVQTRG